MRVVCIFIPAMVYPVGGNTHSCIERTVLERTYELQHNFWNADARAVRQRDRAQAGGGDREPPGLQARFTGRGLHQRGAGRGTWRGPHLRGQRNRGICQRCTSHDRAHGCAPHQRCAQQHPGNAPGSAHHLAALHRGAAHCPGGTGTSSAT